MSGILCAGNVVYDMLVRPADRIKWGATTSVDEIARHVGGNGANTSYAAAILGVPVRLLGFVGEDSFGTELLEILANAGVDLMYLEPVPFYPNFARETCWGE